MNPIKEVSIGELRDRMTRLMAVKRYAKRTEEAYLGAVRKPQRLPEIFSRQEVEALFEAARDRKQRTLLMTAYGAGLRVGELVRLKLRDIDSGRMAIRVSQGKGDQDRYTLLPPRLLQELRAYRRREHPPEWLFARPDGAGPVSRSTTELRPQ
jgi:integrase